jgi:hypothetical protein
MPPVGCPSFTLRWLESKLPQDEATRFVKICRIQSPLPHEELCSLVHNSNIKWTFLNHTSRTDIVVEFMTKDEARDAVRHLKRSRYRAEFAPSANATADFETSTVKKLRTEPQIFYCLPPPGEASKRRQQAEKMIAEVKPCPFPRQRWVDKR